MESFPKSFYAQRAMLAIADTYYPEKDEGNLILAAAQYRSFLSLYPTSPSAPLAQYRIGLCSFNKMLKPGRDQTKTTDALAEFKKTISMFPLTEEAKLSREKIQECENRLAEHLFLIGEHYYKRKAYKPAVNRLAEILTKYPLYPGMDKVYFVLADSHFQSGKLDEAGPYFTKLVTDYATEQVRLQGPETAEGNRGGEEKAAGPGKGPGARQKIRSRRCPHFPVGSRCSSWAREFFSFRPSRRPGRRSVPSASKRESAADYFSRSVVWDERTGSSVLKAALGTVRVGLELPGGASFALLAGYGANNWNGLVFRNLPFSIDYEGGSIGSILIGSGGPGPAFQTREMGNRRLRPVPPVDRARRRMDPDRTPPNRHLRRPGRLR